MIKQILAISLLVSLVVGCSHSRSSTPLQPAIDVDPVDRQLAETARSVSESLHALAQVEYAHTPKSSLPKPENAESLGMSDLASVDWTGPVEPLVQKIAKASHYRLKVLGAEPAIPAIVSINATNATLASILRDAHFQAQKKVDIKVYPETKLIELRYVGL